MTAKTTCHKANKVENMSLSLNQNQTAVCEQVLVILGYLKLLYTAYNMTLVYSPVERIKTKSHFLQGPGTSGSSMGHWYFFTLFILRSGWCRKQSI